LTGLLRSGPGNACLQFGRINI